MSSPSSATPPHVSSAAVSSLSDDDWALLDLARRVAQDSPDRSRKVGAVLVNPQGKILSVGCNTLPDGVEHSDEFLSRPAKYDWTEHAERNALFAVARQGGEGTQGCTAILPWFPCLECTRALVQSGITRLVASEPDVTDPTWGPGFKVALRMLEKANIQFDRIEGLAPPQAVEEGQHAPSSGQSDLTPVADLVAAWNATKAQPRRPRRPG